MAEHILVQQARRMTGDPQQVAQVAAIVARVQAAIDEAVRCVDPIQAGVLLPAALQMLYHEVHPLVGQGLLPGTVWIDQAHHVLYRRAEQVLGRGQGAVQRPSTEPMARPSRVPGQIFPRT